MRTMFLASASAIAIGLAGSAYAADLTTDAPAVPRFVQDEFTWNGLYFGGTAGYYWGDRDSSSPLCGPLDPRDGASSPIDPNIDVGEIGVDVGANSFGLPIDLEFLSPSYACRPFETFPGDGNDGGVGVFIDNTSSSDEGWAAGGFIGVNRQYGDFVVGTELEGLWIDSPNQTRDFNFAWFNDSAPFDLESTATIGGGSWETQGPDWVAHGTVKVGKAVGSMNRALLYVKGGFAVADKQKSSFSGGSTAGCGECFNVAAQSLTTNPTKDSGYGFGGTVGAGLVYKLKQNFGIGLEYQYTYLKYDGEHSVLHTIVKGGEIPIEPDDGDLLEIRFNNKFNDLGLHMVKVRATLHFN